ncbi:MAG: hypothetical protein ACPGVU_23340 [Limisphaerales bacterium]
MSANTQIPDEQYLSATSAAQLLDVSKDTIRRQAASYQVTPIPGKIRYKVLTSSDGQDGYPRYLKSDVLALLHIPKKASSHRPRLTFRARKRR